MDRLDVIVASPRVVGPTDRCAFGGAQRAARSSHRTA
jgi:hypothetical protein